MDNVIARSSHKIDMRETTSIAKADYIVGAAKSLSVLESFDVERQRLNATQAAERTGLTRAAARRHLLTLSHLGYLESDGQHFWLAPRVLRFAGSYLSSARLPRAVRPALRRLAQASRGTYGVAVLDEQETVIVATSSERWGNDHSAPYGVHLGARLPAFCTSTGRAMLSALSSNELKTWLSACKPIRLNAKTVTAKAALTRIVTKSRNDGFAYASEEHELGVHAIAVPLLDHSGQCIAALNCVDYLQTSNENWFVRQVLPALQREAAELRAVL